MTAGCGTNRAFLLSLVWMRTRAKAAGAQNGVRVGKLGGELNGSRTGCNLPVHLDDPSGMGIIFPVSLNVPHRHSRRLPGTDEVPKSLPHSPDSLFSLMLKYAQIGFTCEIVAILVVVPTRSPICDLASPAMPSIGE